MEYSNIFKGLSFSHDIRDRVIETYRQLGGSFHTWMKRDQALMADAITVIEDQVEFEKKNQEYRLPLKMLRRQLEDTNQ